MKNINKLTVHITSNDDYILIDFKSGMHYWEIIEGISRLLEKPEFKDKDDVWLFREGPLKILFSDLYSVKALVEKRYPDSSKGMKRPSSRKRVFNKV